MVADSEHESEAVDWASYDAWQNSVDVARRERQQRGESYMARHRRAADDDGDTTHDET